MFPTNLQKKGSEVVACGKRLFQKRLKSSSLTLLLLRLPWYLMAIPDSKYITDSVMSQF